MNRFSLIAIFLFPLFIFANEKEPSHFDTTKFSAQDSVHHSAINFSDSITIGAGDSLSYAKNDSLNIPQRDSLLKIIPIPHIGSILGSNTSACTIADSQILWIDNRTLSDILWKVPHVYIFDLFTQGQNNNITFGGLDNRYVRILIDGRSEEDPITGIQNIWTISPDEIERIEIISGPEAAFYAQNGNASVINIITKNYYTNKPYTRLRYTQGVDSYTQTDALFTQNIIRGGNLTIGLSHAGYGSNKLYDSYRGRYPNSYNDGWNIRTKFRYNIMNNLNISLSYHYNKATTNLNGGVNILKTSSADVFNDLNAVVYNYESYEKVTNHHLDLTIAVHPFGDTTETATLTGYASNFLREYRDEENRYGMSPFGLNGIFKKINYDSEVRGTKFQFISNNSFNTVTAFAQYEETAYGLAVGGKKTQTPLLGLKDDVTFRDILSLSLFINSAGNTFDKNFGGSAKIFITDNFSVNGGMSKSVYTPFIISSFMPSGSGAAVPINKSNFTSLQAGAGFETPFLSMHVSALQQKIEHPFVLDTSAAINLSYYSPAQYTYNSISADVHAVIGSFHFEGLGNFLLQPDIIRKNLKMTLLPRLSLNGSVYYEGILVKGNLHLKTGFRGRFISEQDGLRPFDEYGVWIPYGITSYGPSSTVDFFATGKIGNAYIHLIAENITNSQYMLAPIYPANDTNIRFGISWEFFD